MTWALEAGDRVPIAGQLVALHLKFAENDLHINQTCRMTILKSSYIRVLGLFWLLRLQWSMHTVKVMAVRQLRPLSEQKCRPKVDQKSDTVMWADQQHINTNLAQLN